MINNRADQELLDLVVYSVTTDLDMEQIIQLVAENCDPEDVFNDTTLRQWAYGNGFTDRPDD